MRKLIALFFAGAATVACFPQGQCTSDPGFVDYCGPGDTTCQGQILDANDWISGPISSQWLNFSREKTILMHFRDAKTGATLSGNFIEADVNINVSSTLATPPNQFVPCAGGNCEENQLVDSASGLATGVYVTNGTCSDYFVYVYVTLSQGTITGGISDAGTD
ncbi:MAG TPA: hypothetical protein VGH28_15765 [Polyangiaceae bacterium]|jgi:hypothetical protein